MLKKFWLVGLFLVLTLPASNVFACGGLFCLNSAVDQNAERIIFTDNGDGTISALVQIQYTGFSKDFSWILPLTSPITAEDIQVPNDAMAAFTEIGQITAPRFIAPPLPECAQNAIAMMVVEDNALYEEVPNEVAVLASGEVGPYSFDVIESSDPSALITWLREHNYRVTEPMEPLIDIYVEEDFYFLAMRLLPEQETQDIQPVQITYKGNKPMIPLRLTAVAANPDMPVIVWFYGQAQYVPENYAHMQIADEEIVFDEFQNHNYRQLVTQKADSFEGLAFVTEFAGNTQDLNVQHPLLQELSHKHRYLTRLRAEISPEEMTIDPMFVYDTNQSDVSNIHDLSHMTGLYACEQEVQNNSLLTTLFGSKESTSTSGTTSSDNNSADFARILVIIGVIAFAWWIIGRSRSS